MSRRPEQVKYILCAICWTFLVILLISCGGEKKEEEKTKLTWTKLPAEATVEIARTKEERNKGLKFREYLQKDSGMYFITEREEVQQFWMKDTRIPLSIAFINSENIIIAIKDMRPYDTRGTSSDKPAKYILEMDRGWFSKQGIRVGDKALLENTAVYFYRGTITAE